LRITKTRDYYARQLTAFEQKEATHSIEYYLGLVQESFESGDYETTISHLGKIWELDPNDTRSILLRARMYAILKRYDDAMSDINFVLYLEPENEDALKFKEKILKKSDDFRKFRAFPIYS
jgi:tetratricopeptide (TPR) repeat protein